MSKEERAEMGLGLRVGASVRDSFRATFQLSSAAFHRSGGHVVFPSPAFGN